MRIIVLAGGFDQIALIEELKRRNHIVILIDYFENPPAKPYADKHIVASTLDVDQVKKIAKDEKAELICTACTDQALLTVAKVSEDLNLPCYISYQTALNVTNKSYMKNVLMKNNIPTAKYIVSSTLDEASINSLKFPLVVKPVDCNSSKGVKRVDSVTELSEYFNEAVECSRSGLAVVEEYKEGQEISADFYIENGTVKLLSATNSFKIPHRRSFTILGSSYPGINNMQEAKLIKIATDITRVFELNNCPLLIQLIANGKDLSVIEFSARMGGGSKYRLIETLCGVNIMSKYVDLILGGCPSVLPSKKVNFCKVIYCYCKPGIFDHIEGLQDLKDEGIIAEYFIYKTKGMKIDHAENSGDRILGYLVVADNTEDIDVKIKKADSAIRVVDMAGNDILIHNLYDGSLA